MKNWNCIWRNICSCLWRTHEHLKLSKILNIAFFIFFQRVTKNKIFSQWFIFHCLLFKLFLEFMKIFHSLFVLFSPKILHSLPISYEEKNRKVKNSFLTFYYLYFFYRHNKPKYAAKFLIKCDVKPR